MKKIPDYDYYVTVSGNVCNKHAKILKPYIDDGGFSAVSLYKNGKKKNARVHILVAQLYIDNPRNYNSVGHIDGDKRNNHFNNLEWIEKECINKTVRGKRKEKEYIDKKCGKPIDDENTYFITDGGKLYNRKGMIMSTFYETRTKFEMVTLRIEGRKKDFLIHRLVAQVYIPNPDDYKFIKHLDGDINNNKANNLVWVKERYEMKVGTIFTLPGELVFEEIPGFSNYFITKDGKVYSLKTGEYLKMQTKEGYHTVNLRRDNKGHCRHVHKLVGYAYLEKKEGDVCVNHKNGEKKDNRVENLEWCTKAHDVKHALSTGLNPGRKRAVIQYEIKYKSKCKEIYPSMSKASKATGISAGAICTCCQGRTLIGAGRKPTRSGKVYKFRYRSLEAADGMAREIVVREMKPKEKVVKTYETTAEAGRETGIDVTSITHCCKGNMKFAISNGIQYYWKYETPDPDEPDTDNEDWREIPGFSKYKVSTIGEVYSTYYNRVLDKQDNGDYETISLVNDDGDRHSMKVHRLVALAFHENEKKKRVVNHKDKEKKNNKKDNLEWNTDSENVLHAMDNGSNSRRKEVIQYDKDRSEIKRYKSCKEAAKEMGVAASTVANACTGRQKTCKGYVFKYE